MFEKTNLENCLLVFKYRSKIKIPVETQIYIYPHIFLASLKHILQQIKIQFNAILSYLLLINYYITYIIYNFWMYLECIHIYFEQYKYTKNTFFGHFKHEFFIKYITFIIIIILFIIY